MSRRQTVIMVLLFIAITIAGFVFGRIILPRLFLKSIEKTLETSESTWDKSGGLEPVLAAAVDGTPSNGAVLNETPSLEDIAIDVDVTAQVVKIIKGQEVIKEMIASTGVEGHETPLGTFEVQNRGTWFYNDKYKQGAKYWVSFRDWGLYLIHSVAMDKNRQAIPEEEAKLGQPASHGCVRLKVEDAKWIYDNVPEKTKVVIHR